MSRHGEIDGWVRALERRLHTQAEFVGKVYDYAFCGQLRARGMPAGTPETKKAKKTGLAGPLPDST